MTFAGFDLPPELRMLRDTAAEFVAEEIWPSKWASTRATRRFRHWILRLSKRRAARGALVHGRPGSLRRRRSGYLRTVCRR